MSPSRQSGRSVTDTSGGSASRAMSTGRRVRRSSETKQGGDIAASITCTTKIYFSTLPQIASLSTSFHGRASVLTYHLSPLKSPSVYHYTAAMARSISSGYLSFNQQMDIHLLSLPIFRWGAQHTGSCGSNGTHNTGKLPTSKAARAGFGSGIIAA
jgi:hypothetical protein